ncbi:MAG: malto-oligosyltrehalose synthase [Candidatus Omnitrophica bacterium]|nr:malto-oligosyltrehalose synthase [Candidatus Omnitrophota bacterium]
MHIPRATYRIQFSPVFGFKDLEAILPYLHKLGVSDIYASPILKARFGSQHGYDVTDPSTINPQLGTHEEFESLIKSVQDQGMFWLQDIVPNHMAYHKENDMLMDIFEKREHSLYFEYFDIDWVHMYESYQGRVLAPFLGKFYSEALSDGEIKVVYNQGGLFIRYYDLCFPLYLDTYKDVLLNNISCLEQTLGEYDSTYIKFYGAVDIFSALLNKDKLDCDNHQVLHAKKMLWDCYQNATIKSFVDDNLLFFNGKKDKDRGLEFFDLLLSRQCYRLSFWKVASEELNYRRFFTINDLISLRVEQRNVFNVTHDFIKKLKQENKIHGLRIDHVDGLYDPTVYLKRLSAAMKDTFIVTEKILAGDEKLPPDWPIQGTTGYDFMNRVNGVLCRTKSKADFIKIYYKFTKLHFRYEYLVDQTKRLIIDKHMAGDIENLAYLMKKVASRDRYGRDITLFGLKRALVAVLTAFPVYRTYLSSLHRNEHEKVYIQTAITKSLKHHPGLEYEIKFIKKFLLLEIEDSLREDEKRDFWHFIMRFQQITSPIMAKGFEDTFFYSYNKLISLNEVGGDPGCFGITRHDFHHFNQQRFAQFPHTLNATATHDTKRGEDARARINVLSEIPEDWKNALKTWSKMNRARKRKIDGAYIPDANDEYFIYQSMLGAFPFDLSELDSFKQRLKDYTIKAIREAKVHTAWIKPDTVYEETCLAFIDKILNQDTDNKFLNEFIPFQKHIAHYGILNSLSQTLLKMTGVGVPDFYQGTDLWDFSFVDPDNRRPVDYKKRLLCLDDIDVRSRNDMDLLLCDLWQSRQDGRIKLFLIHQILQCRRQQEELFLDGTYHPLTVKGTHEDCLVAFYRKRKNTVVLVIAPRFFTEIVKTDESPTGENVWGETFIECPQELVGRGFNAITRKTFDIMPDLNVGHVLKVFPVAILLSEEDG